MARNQHCSEKSGESKSLDFLKKALRANVSLFALQCPVFLSWFSALASAVDRPSSAGQSEFWLLLFQHQLLFGVSQVKNVLIHENGSEISTFDTLQSTLDNPKKNEQDNVRFIAVHAVNSMKFNHQTTNLTRTFLILLLLLSLPSMFGINLGNRAANAQSATQITTSWLDQQKAAWAPSKITPIDFASLFKGLSYSNVYAAYYTTPVLNTELDMLLQTGVQAVRVDLNYDPWLRNDSAKIATYSNYIEGLQKNGTRVIIADSAAESYRTNPIPWAQFKTAWIQRVTKIASLYHPEFYIVVKEPEWYFPMISDVQTNPDVVNVSDWVALTRSLVNAVKQVSPSTKVGVAVPGNLYHDQANIEASYFGNVSSISNLDFMGFDIYGIQGFTDTLNFLNSVGTNGKQVWIAEAWSTLATTAYDPTRISLDVEWLQVLYYFALKINATMVMPFFTDLYSSYNTPPTNAAQLQQYYEQRTATFSEFQQIISTNKSGEPLPTNTTLDTQTTSATTFTTSKTDTSHPARYSSLYLEIGVAVVVVAVVAAIAAVYRRGRKQG